MMNLFKKSFFLLITQKLLAYTVVVVLSNTLGGEDYGTYLAIFSTMTIFLAVGKAGLPALIFKNLSSKKVVSSLPAGLSTLLLYVLLFSLISFYALTFGI